jgi:hypothetical protein
MDDRVKSLYVWLFKCSITIKWIVEMPYRVVDRYGFVTNTYYVQDLIRRYRI